MKFIVIEGADGTGKSSRARDIVADLATRGIPASLFKHPKPTETIGPIERAFFYAMQRQAFVRRARETGGVWVADRWYYSTAMLSRALGPGPVSTSLRDIVSAEMRTLPEALVVAKLDAPSDVLDAGRAKRGEEVIGDLDAGIRAAYRNWDVPALDTSMDGTVVREQLLRAALAALGVA